MVGQYNPRQALNNGDGFKFYVQFNHLLLRFAQAPCANVTYQSWHGELPVRLFPDASPPKSRRISRFTRDIMKFEHAVILETWLNCPGNIA